MRIRLGRLAALWIFAIPQIVHAAQPAAFQPTVFTQTVTRLETRILDIQQPQSIRLKAAKELKKYVVESSDSLLRTQNPAYDPDLLVTVHGLETFFDVVDLEHFSASQCEPFLFRIMALASPQDPSPQQLPSEALRVYRMTAALCK